MSILPNIPTSSDVERLRPRGFTPKPSEDDRIDAKAERTAARQEKKRTAAKKHGLVKTRKPISKLARREAMRKAKKACQDCGRKVGDQADDGGPVKLHIDHTHPLAQDGADDPSNYRVLCADCNQAKGASRDFQAEEEIASAKPELTPAQQAENYEWRNGKAEEPKLKALIGRGAAEKPRGTK